MLSVAVPVQRYRQVLAALMLFFTLSRWSRRREATVNAAPAPAPPDGVADV